MSEFSWSEFFIGAAAGTMVCLMGSLGAIRWAQKRGAVLERRAREAERLAELGTLTAGLAHEIKNPLSTIQLNLQLLQEDLPQEKQGDRRFSARLATVRQEASRLREILDDFLRYAGRVEVEKASTDIGKMLEEVFDFFQPQASMSRVELRLTAPDHPIIASIDQRLVKQALLNLLLNATQAMHETGGEIILGARLAPSSRSPTVLISVTDTGPGIDPEKREQIFKAYFTTRKGGTGLGLPIAKRVADEHGGTLLLSSEPGRGSVFTLALPV